MSLKDAIDNVKPTNSNKSDKTPKFYNQKKARFVHNMTHHEDSIVRAAALGDAECPKSILNKALQVEKDPVILRELLMNSRISLKSVNEFVTDNPDIFNGDTEVETFLVQRFEASDNNSSDLQVEDDSIFDEDAE